MILNIFRRSRPVAPATNELPADVLAALDGMHVMLRPHGEDGVPRALVQIAGHRGGWIHSLDDDLRHLAMVFPELSQEQLARAHRFIAAQVRRRVQLANEPEPGVQRKTWANHWEPRSYDSI